MNKIDNIRAEIEHRIKANKTKNGFPAGTLCAARIEVYEDLISFINSIPEEPDKSLEEEISRTYHDGSVTDTENIDHVAYENIARHFAKWQKEQMMKEAVEGEITKDNRGNNVVRAGVFNKDFEYGDKVRIIVLPKEVEK